MARPAVDERRPALRQEDRLELARLAQVPVQLERVSLGAAGANRRMVVADEEDCLLRGLRPPFALVRRVLAIRCGLSVATRRSKITQSSSWCTTRTASSGDARARRSSRATRSRSGKDEELRTLGPNASR